MKTAVILFACLFSLAFCNKQNFDVQIESLKYSNVPDTFELCQPGYKRPENEFIPYNSIKDVDFGPGKDSKGIHAVLNDYADKIFNNLQTFMVENGLDPTSMPDIHTGFNYTFIITYHGELDLTKGWLLDISTIHREGDVNVEYSTTDKYLKVVIPIAFDDLQFTYSYSAKIMGLGPVGGIEGKINGVKVVAEIGFNTDTLIASMDHFEIAESGHISLHFTGNILVDWLVNLLSETVTTVLKPVILCIVQFIIVDGLNGAVDAINNVIQGILNPPNPGTTTAAPVEELLGKLLQYRFA